MFPYTVKTQDTAPLQVDNTVRRGGTQIMKRQSIAVHFHTIVGYIPVHRYKTRNRTVPSGQHVKTQDTALLQVDNTVRRGGTQIMKRQSIAVHFHTIVGYIPVHRYKTRNRTVPSGQHGTARWYSDQEAAKDRRAFSW
ncbi:hypothetical protein J6590_074249 [Homalodisca vitripennis]|nr:hypothetical protein J6590_074249 [Homalodisca vitripennis]